MTAEIFYDNLLSRKISSKSYPNVSYCVSYTELVILTNVRKDRLREKEGSYARG